MVPVKHSTIGKSRLAATLGTHRPDLAVAMALDVVLACLQCPGVAAVTVVTDDPAVAQPAREAGAAVLADDPGRGLNEALLHGLAATAARHPDAGQVCVASDLAAARADELAVVLAAAADEAPMGPVTAIVRDAEGTGTSLLMGTAGVALRPRYGSASAAAHLHHGAQDLTALAGPGLRRDVDTVEDLMTALRLGVGPRTEQLVRQRLLRPATVVERTDRAVVLVEESGARLVAPLPDVLLPPMVEVHPGQAVDVLLAADGSVAAVTVPPGSPERTAQ